MLLGLFAAIVMTPQTTWVVDADNGPGTNFPDLPQAVAAAAHGDTILVRRGEYSAFQVAGKALTIRGAGGAYTRVLLGTQGMVIDAVPAGSVFFLHGMYIRPPNPTSKQARDALRVLGASSVVAMGRCWLQGPVYAVNAIQRSGGAGLTIEDAQVFAADCTFTGGSAQAFWGGLLTGGPGVRVTRATLVASRCRLQGGSGEVIKQGIAAGGAGLSVAGGAATAAACSFLGGLGYAFDSGLSTGGHGVELTSAATFARMTGAQFDLIQGGAGNVPGIPIAALDAAAAAVVHGNVPLQPGVAGGLLTTGNVTLGAPELPRVAILGVFSLSGEVLAGNPLTVTVEGVPALAPVLLGFSPRPEFSMALAPLTLGEVVLPIASFRFGAVLDGGGQFAHFFPPSIPPAFVGVPVFGQVAVLDVANNQIRMSNLDLRVYAN